LPPVNSKENLYIHEDWFGSLLFAGYMFSTCLISYTETHVVIDPTIMRLTW
jgi:hypothetical protein